ncbi:hypothetical protein [Mycolicibacterium aubagnense]|uniref:Uncharacterized protein n=1 Tax=Mycolicibacterium aubagnense TaxID=319707 RepID=A0ABN5YL94_9MYCO|nr:hypothetical protein [Mycolicibacterium aubagnense]TLH64462.1 hypothetical protein C1S80_12415 [Mycolicibacterium aubagnense]BBX82196.1 hypothetical protein MAUB_00690 [Mycolicibacterium aubagnense]
MTAVWLLDFDGVINALSKRGGRSYWPEWSSATVAHPEGDLTSAGDPVHLPLLWSPAVIAVIAEAARAGIDVRWLSTWREHTKRLPEIIPGLPDLPWLDETILDTRASDDLDPRLAMESGPWKVLVARAFVPAGAALLWTEDSLTVDLLSESWRRSRTAPTTLIRPRPATGLISREVNEIREWIHTHA